MLDAKPKSFQMSLIDDFNESTETSYLPASVSFGDTHLPQNGYAAGFESADNVRVSFNKYRNCINKKTTFGIHIIRNGVVMVIPYSRLMIIVVL